MNGMKSSSLLTAILVATLALGGCAKVPKAHADADAKPRAPVGEMSSVDVANDKDVLVVSGNPSVKRPIVHLHGMCGSPKADLDAWGAAVAAQHGTIIAVTGDVPCPGQQGAFQWSSDAAKIDARITAAIDAVNAARSLELDKSEVLLVGESMGAARAELLATKNSERYARLVLVGSPQTPSPQNLAGVRAVANLAGEKEGQAAMKNGARALSAAGKASQFWELPGAVHGEYGPDGARIMTEAVAFVATR